MWWLHVILEMHILCEDEEEALNCDSFTSTWARGIWNPDVIDIVTSIRLAGLGKDAILPC